MTSVVCSTDCVEDSKSGDYLGVKFSYKSTIEVEIKIIPLFLARVEEDSKTHHYSISYLTDSGIVIYHMVITSWSLAATDASSLILEVEMATWQRSNVVDGFNGYGQGLSLSCRII